MDCCDARNSYHLRSRCQTTTTVSIIRVCYCFNGSGIVESALESRVTPKAPAIYFEPIVPRNSKPRLETKDPPPSGYPSYCSYLSRNPELQCFRRFSEVRMRILLFKQDAVTQLEQELWKVDREEEDSTLWLDTNRRDKNEVRKTVLQDLEVALKDYGKRRVRSQDPAQPCDGILIA